MNNIYPKIGQEFSELGLAAAWSFAEFSGKLYNSGNTELANAFSNSMANFSAAIDAHY